MLRVMVAVLWCAQVNKGEYVRMFLEHIYAPIIMNPVAKVRPATTVTLATPATMVPPGHSIPDA